MTPRKCALTMVLLWSAILAGFGGQVATAGAASGTAACPVSGDANSKGSGSISIGRKGFAEEQLLASMTELVLKKHGFTVTNTFEAKDPALGQALLNNTIDAYWQYTGTELQGPLGVPNPPGDLDQAFQLAKTKDEANGICWNDKGTFNDTNGLAATAANKSKYGATLSDLSTYLAAHPQTKVCVNSEFITRPDGIPGLNSAYGKNFSGSGVIGSAQSTFEPAIASGQCEVGEVFTTDSGIAAKNLYVFGDDKKFFPPDNVGLLLKSNVQKAHPEIPAIMQPVIDKLDNATITDLNKQVEIDNKKYQDVAQAFLSSNGLLNAPTTPAPASAFPWVPVIIVVLVIAAIGGFVVMRQRQQQI